MPPPSRKPIRVVAALIRRGDTVLVQQRAAEKVRGGSWELPGGKVEAGESDESALARELQEELGIDVDVGARLDRVVHVYDDVTIELVLYGTSLADELEPVSSEGARVAWVTARELSDLDFSAADRPLVRRHAGDEA